MTTPILDTPAPVAPLSQADEWRLRDRLRELRAADLRYQRSVEAGYRPTVAERLAIRANWDEQDAIHARLGV